MAMEGQIVVTPQELEAQAQQVNKAAGDLKNCFDRMKTLVAETGNYWKGDAADAHRNNYNKNQTSIEEIVERYLEHVKDLEHMAGIYRKAETSAKNLADDLPVSTL